MILQIKHPDGYTIAEAPIPEGLLEGLINGSLSEIIFPMDIGPTPRMVIIKEPAP